MTVVRELVTKLGFQVDRTGLDRFEKSIIGFKTKFALASAAVTAAVSKTLDYFRDISKAAIDTKGLAEQTGIATERFVALRKAAEGFQVDPHQFDAYFQRLSGLLREAESGYGELFEIIRKSRGKLNLTPFIRNHDVEGAFKAVVDYVQQLEKIPDKVAVVADVLGESNPTGLLRLVKAGSEAFTEATEKNKAFGEQFTANEPAIEDYTKKLNAFSNSLEKLQNAFVRNVLPVVTEVVGLTTQVLNGDAFSGLGIIKDEVKDKGFLSGLNFVGEAIANYVYEKLGYETLQQAQMKAYEEDQYFYRKLAEMQQQQRLNNTNTTVTNRIDINVAPGTSEEQAQIIGQEVRGAMEQFYQEKTREVLNNYPQAE